MAILRPDLDPLGARNQSTVAGHGEGSPFDAGAAGLLRISGLINTSCFFAVLGDIDDDDALMNVDLGRSQADRAPPRTWFQHIITNVFVTRCKGFDGAATVRRRSSGKRNTSRMAIITASFI